MHRVIGDRTRALGGALTVAGLCWDLTNFATTRRGVARYHGGRRDSPCVRFRLRSSLTHLRVGSLRCSPPPSPGPSGGPLRETTTPFSGHQPRLPNKSHG